MSPRYAGRVTSPRVSVSLERGLANWPAMRPILTMGIDAPYVSTTAIWSTVLMRLRICSAVAQVVDLAREHQRGQCGELCGCGRHQLGVIPLRLLLDGQGPPVVECVELLKHPSSLAVAGRRPAPRDARSPGRQERFFFRRSFTVEA